MRSSRFVLMMQEHFDTEQQQLCVETVLLLFILLLVVFQKEVYELMQNFQVIHLFGRHQKKKKKKTKKLLLHDKARKRKKHKNSHKHSRVVRIIDPKQEEGEEMSDTIESTSCSSSRYIGEMMTPTMITSSQANNNIDMNVASSCSAVLNEKIHHDGRWIEENKVTMCMEGSSSAGEKIDDSRRIDEEEGEASDSGRASFRKTRLEKCASEEIAAIAAPMITTRNLSFDLSERQSSCPTMVDPTRATEISLRVRRLMKQRQQQQAGSSSSSLIAQRKSNHHRVFSELTSSSSRKNSTASTLPTTAQEEIGSRSNSSSSGRRNLQHWQSQESLSSSASGSSSGDKFENSAAAAAATAVAGQSARSSTATRIFSRTKATPRSTSIQNSSISRSSSSSLRRASQRDITAAAAAAAASTRSRKSKRCYHPPPISNVDRQILERIKSGGLNNPSSPW